MIRIGLHGNNAHQIHNSLEAHRLGVLSAISAFPEEELPEKLRADATIRRCASLEELLALPDIDCVSLCSPHRKDQAHDAILAMQAGKHVLAEKPCAMSESDLDALIQTSRETGRLFHEMAGTAFCQPYYAMRQLVLSGKLGEIVQVVAEKSYPYHADRAQNEDMDGGQIGQNAIHALRFVEHVACVPISSIHAVETGLGNPVSRGGLRMAASMFMTLENGGVASVSSNYLNPVGTGIWGYESLKILGTQGMAESRAGGQYTRWVVGKTDHGPLDTSEPDINWLDLFLLEQTGHTRFPLSLEEELSPTRWTIRAKKSLVSPPTFPAKVPLASAKRLPH